MPETQAEVLSNDMRLLAQIARRLEGLSRSGKSYLFDQLAIELDLDYFPPKERSDAP